MVQICCVQAFLYRLQGVQACFDLLAAFSYFSIISWVQRSVSKGRVDFLPMQMKRLQKKMASSSAEMGNLLYFATNLVKVLCPLKRSDTSSTPQASQASCLHPFLPTLVQGLRVSGQTSTLTLLNCLRPQHQLTSGLGSGGICTLQSRKMSEADLDSWMRVERKKTSSSLRYLQHLGMMSLTFCTCCLSADPSIGTNMAHTSRSQKSMETLVMSTKKPFWQSPLKMVWKPFWKLLLYLLSLNSILSRARVRKKCSLTPLCRGYLSTRSIFTIGSMLKMWNRKTSLLVGRLKKPLFTTYHSATSAVTRVVTNIDSPQKLAVVVEFLRRQARCSARFSLMGLRNSICPSLTRYQMTAKQRCRLPSCFPPDISWAIVQLPTSTCDSWLPSGIAPNTLFLVNGFWQIFPLSLVPMQWEILALSLALTAGWLRILRGQAAMSSTMPLSKSISTGSPSSIRICGTSSSMMMGHSITLLVSLSMGTFVSSSDSSTTGASLTLLDWISPTSNLSLRSPQRVMRQLIFFSMSMERSTDMYSQVIFCAYSRAAAVFCSSRHCLISLEQFSSVLMLESSQTSLFLRSSSWSFISGKPCLPMLCFRIARSSFSTQASKLLSLMKPRSLDSSRCSASRQDSSCISEVLVHLAQTVLSPQRRKGQIEEQSIREAEWFGLMRQQIVACSLNCCLAAWKTSSVFSTILGFTLPSLMMMTWVSLLLTMVLASAVVSVLPCPLLLSCACHLASSQVISLVLSFQKKQRWISFLLAMRLPTISQQVKLPLTDYVFLMKMAQTGSQSII